MFTGLAAVYVAVHLWTLPYSPLPWYDETYNASITMSLLEEGRFVPKPAYYASDLKEDLRYGPVYFAFTTCLFWLAGPGIFQLRIVTLLSGLACVWVSALLLRRQGTAPGWVLPAFTALLSLDPYYYRCMHEGRMDLTASAFMLFSIHILIGLTTGRRQAWRQYALSGLFAGLALLTTPRIGFMAPAVAAVWAFHLAKKGWRTSLVQGAVWLLPILVPYLLWVAYAFGGPAGMFRYYQAQAGYLQLTGFYLYLQKNQYVLIPLVLACSAMAMKQQGKAYFGPLNTVSWLGIVFFYLIVKDPGPYAAMITPFYYILLFGPFTGKKRHLPEKGRILAEDSPGPVPG